MKNKTKTLISCIPCEDVNCEKCISEVYSIVDKAHNYFSTDRFCHFGGISSCVLESLLFYLLAKLEGKPKRRSKLLRARKK